MKILIVDDDAFILELLSKALEREGHQAEISPDAGNAMVRLKDDGAFDLVITDIVMPGKDGAQLAREIKEMDGNIPIIAITGGVENAIEDYRNYAEMFTDETLCKPFKPEELIEAVARVTAH